MTDNYSYGPKELDSHRRRRPRRSAREDLNGHRACVIWITGLPASGKTTLAIEIEHQLLDLGIHPYLLDGDAVRSQLNSDLGYSREDRAENIRRLAHIALLMMDAGIVTIVAAVSPFSEDRARARNLFDESEFIEVFIDTPLEVCVERDPKGLYLHARVTDDPLVTGYRQPYEAPQNPTLKVDGIAPAEHSARLLMDLIRPRVCTESEGHAMRTRRTTNPLKH